MEATQELLDMLDFSDGIAHSEWRISDDGKIYLMEVASRTPGDGIMPLYNLACGASLEDTILNVMLGMKSSYPNPFRISRQVYLEHPQGTFMGLRVDWPGAEVTWLCDHDIWSIIPPGNLNDEPALRAIHIYKKRGDTLGPLESSDDRAVALFIDATSVEELDQLEKEIKSRIYWDVKNEY